MLFTLDKIIEIEKTLFAPTNPNNEILENNEMVFLKYTLLPHLDQFFKGRITAFKDYYAEKREITSQYSIYLMGFKLVLFLFSFFYIIARINSVLLSNLVILRALTFITDPTLEVIISLSIRIKSIFTEVDEFELLEDNKKAEKMQIGLASIPKNATKKILNIPDDGSELIQNSIYK